MELDKPVSATTIPLVARAAANTTPSTLESATEGSVSQNYVAEKSILDEDVPAIEGLREPINSTKIPTMLPRDGGLATSRWAPRMTLDGREIEG